MDATHMLDLDAFVEAARGQLRKRLAQALSEELRPLGLEVREISTSTNGSAPRRSPNERSSQRRGRPKGSGPRERKILELLAAAPQGLEVSEIAQRFEMPPNYLYRKLPKLVAAGKVRLVEDGRRRRYMLEQTPARSGDAASV